MKNNKNKKPKIHISSSWKISRIFEKVWFSPGSLWNKLKNMRSKWMNGKRRRHGRRRQHVRSFHMGSERRASREGGISIWRHWKFEINTHTEAQLIARMEFIWNDRKKTTTRSAKHLFWRKQQTYVVTWGVISYFMWWRWKTKDSVITYLAAFARYCQICSLRVCARMWNWAGVAEVAFGLSSNSWVRVSEETFMTSWSFVKSVFSFSYPNSHIWLCIVYCIISTYVAVRQERALSCGSRRNRIEKLIITPKIRKIVSHLPFSYFPLPPLLLYPHTQQQSQTPSRCILAAVSCVSSNGFDDVANYTWELLMIVHMKN